MSAMKRKLNPLESKVIWSNAGVEVPDDCRAVLVHTPSWSSNPVSAGYHDGSDWYWVDGDLHIKHLVTHWADFPKPPAE